MEIINRITGRTTDKSNAMEYLKLGNIEEYNAKEIVREFGNYLSQVGERFANKIQNSQSSITNYLARIPPNPRSLFVTPTNNNKLNKLPVQNQ